MSRLRDFNLGKVLTAILSGTFIAWAGWLSTKMIQVSESVSVIQATFPEGGINTIKDEIKADLKEDYMALQNDDDASNVRISNIEDDVITLKIDVATLKATTQH